MNEKLRKALEAMRKALELCENEGVEFGLEDGGMSIAHNEIETVHVGVYLCPRDLDFLDVP